MRARLASIFIVIVMAFTLIPAAAATNSTDASASVDVVNCTSVRIASDRLEVKCTAAGLVVLDTVIKLPVDTVTLPPLPGATVTVHVPGPSETRTIKVPVPGPTQSVTVTAPASTATATTTATVRSTKTVTATTTKSTGQVDNPSATIGPDSSSEPIISIPAITKSPLKAAGLGLLTLFVLMALILLGLYLGYILGYKDSDKSNAGFMKALLNKTK